MCRRDHPSARKYPRLDLLVLHQGTAVRIIDQQQRKLLRTDGWSDRLFTEVRWGDTALLGGEYLQSIALPRSSGTKDQTDVEALGVQDGSFMGELFQPQ